MTDLALRLAGGVQALIALGWGTAAVSRLGETDSTPSDAVGWAAYLAGGACVALMVGAGLRVALGEEMAAGRRTGLLGGTLIAGLAGILLMAAAGAS